MDQTKKQHWHLLAFSVPVPGNWQPVSITIGLPSRNVPTVQVVAARNQNGLPESSVLVGISYHGYMTAHQMQGTREADKQSSLTEQFKQGLQSAALQSLGHTVVNPYLDIDSAEGRFFSTEWQTGFNEAQDAQAVAECVTTQSAESTAQ